MTDTALTIAPMTLAQVGQVASAYAAQNVFTDYQDRIAANTRRRQAGDVALFAGYLALTGVTLSVHDLMYVPGAWHGITYGLVEGFVRYQLQQGYAIGSINVRLATIKKYTALATKAGIIPPTEHALIALVEGYSHAEGRHVDQTRDTTRKGAKKAQPVSLSPAQAKALKHQPDTPQGKRDALLMCLLLDHGLRCGEVEGLTVQSINLAEGTLTFYREKVNKVQIHALTGDTLRAAIKYLNSCSPSDKLLAGSRKNGVLTGVMSERAITNRVRVLGETIGVNGLSAHDCRHYWATAAIKGGTDIKSLQDAGGWSSPAMPLRYAESASVANQGVKLAG